MSTVLNLEHLNAEIASRVMGWTGVRPARTGAHGYKSPWGHAPYLGQTVWMPVPRYSGDLNECAKVEARIVEMGLGSHYLNTLREIAPSAAELDIPRDLWIATASAEARCRTILRALDAVEGK